MVFKKYMLVACSFFSAASRRNIIFQTFEGKRQRKRHFQFSILVYRNTSEKYKYFRVENSSQSHQNKLSKTNGFA